MRVRDKDTSCICVPKPTTTAAVAAWLHMLRAAAGAAAAAVVQRRKKKKQYFWPYGLNFVFIFVVFVVWFGSWEKGRVIQAITDGPPKTRRHPCWGRAFFTSSSINSAWGRPKGARKCWLAGCWRALRSHMCYYYWLYIKYQVRLS